jgi:proteasome accessory factor C
MSKNPVTPLDQTARLLDLVPFLITHQGISLNELASHFKVSEDVLLDDLNTLWMCGLPGYTPLELIDLAFDSGYVTIRNASTLAAVRTMSSSEIASLLFGLDLLRQSVDAADTDTYIRIEALSKKLQSRIGKVVFSADTSGRFYALISKAIVDRSSLLIRYFSLGNDEMSERIVSPLHFFNLQGDQYFEAFCHAANSIRTFKLDRVEQAEFVPTPAGKQESGAKDSSKVRALATVHRGDRAAAEVLSLTYGSLVAGATLEVEAFSTEWLLRAIASSAGALSVEEPTGIRSTIFEGITRTLALYE